MVLWPGTQNNHGGNANLWQVAEWILVNAAGTSPLDFLDMPTPFSLWNGSGERIDVPWPLPASDFEPFCDYYPQVADWPIYAGKINLKGLPNPFLTICKDQALFPYQPCNVCRGNHPDLGLFPGKNLYNVYKHWPVTEMEDFVEWVPAGDEIGQVATHTSFVSVNPMRRRSPADYVPTPDQGRPGTCWWEPRPRAAMAPSWKHWPTPTAGQPPSRSIATPANRSTCTAAGCCWKATTFPCAPTPSAKQPATTGSSLTMNPTAPQLNPVFLINGWTSPGVQVLVDDRPLDRDRYRAQVYGHDLTVWVQGRFEKTTKFSFIV
ncbi:MAG: hypothetical protein M5U28_11235 [Sandaracinaceae bacterium]|nr:hypothetical protein [Sandaracinaceae bacterium]